MLVNQSLAAVTRPLDAGVARPKCVRRSCAVVELSEDAIVQARATNAILPLITVSIRNKY